MFVWSPAHANTNTGRQTHTPGRPCINFTKNRVNCVPPVVYFRNAQWISLSNKVKTPIQDHQVHLTRASPVHSPASQCSKTLTPLYTVESSSLQRTSRIKSTPPSSTYKVSVTMLGLKRNLTAHQKYFSFHSSRQQAEREHLHLYLKGEWNRAKRKDLAPGLTLHHRGVSQQSGVSGTGIIH